MQADFDFEVEAYSRHLEVVYRLCRDCELKVQSELQRQDKEIKKHYSTESDDDSDNVSQISGYSVCSVWLKSVYKNVSLLFYVPKEVYKQK